MLAGVLLQVGRMRSLLAVALLAACADTTVQLPESPEQHRAAMFELPQLSPRPVDVLLVIDNSSAMSAYEKRVAANLPALAQPLDGQIWWDVHVGVITADVGCAGGAAWRYDHLSNDPFLIHWRHLDRTTTQNFTGELAGQLVALAAAGDRGCGLHRPLDAIEHALDAPPAGFRRADADLLVVVIGASDDASRTSIEAAAERYARRPGEPITALLAVYPEGSSRLDAFTETIAKRDPFLALASTSRIGDARWGAFGFWWPSSHHGWANPCVEAELVDLELDTYGLQADCSVSDVARSTTHELLYERILPACDGANRPCWRVVGDAMNCPSGSRLAVQIERVDFPPRGTNTVGYCLTAAPTE